jgi:hypothetical protein
VTIKKKRVSEIVDLGDFKNLRDLKAGIDFGDFKNLRDLTGRVDFGSFKNFRSLGLRERTT